MEPFKNLLDAQAAGKIARALTRTYPQFPAKAFLKGIERELEPLELKQRMLLIKARLDSSLPSGLDESFAILRAALKQSEDDTIGLSGFLVWPLTEFVAANGIDKPDLSMKALYDMTQVFTAEFAIRPLLIRHEERVLRLLSKWAQDESEHVRRLVSEGTRPLLPWGQRLPEFVRSPEKTWSLLEALKNDPSKYVQKSVANHINDHSKHHPDWVVKKLKAWRKEAKPKSSLEWIIRHGTRTLIKQGHPGALALQGIESIDFGKVRTKVLNQRIRVGESLEVRLSLANPLARKASVVVDCRILFLKANGKHGPKVFKGKSLFLEPGEKKVIDLKIPLRPVTTRRYYPGQHGCVLLINGTPTEQMSFELLPAESAGTKSRQ